MRRSTVAAMLSAMLSPMPCLVSATPSDISVEPAQFFSEFNSTRVKIRYGPFVAPAMNVNNGMGQFSREEIEMPCTDCLITWMQAGLEYPNGTVANANTNLWLHHTVFANMNRTSTVCPGPSTPDSFFASGNERTPIDICVNGTDQAGYYLRSTDKLSMLVELMNMSPAPQLGVVTMTYEYIPNPPSSFSQVKALWLDIGGCNGSSDQPVKSTTQPFEYTSPAWVSDISGRVTFIGGHLHDGGTELLVFRNKTQECDCAATYGANSAYIGGGMMVSTSATMTMSMPTSSPGSMDMSSTTMSMSMSSTPTSVMTTPTSSTSSGLVDNVHISNISTCSNPNNGVVSPGDIWTITAHYDPSQHDLMFDMNGTAAPIMGIALVYVADLNVTVAASGSSTGNVTGTSGSERSLGLGIGSVGLFIGLILGEILLIDIV